MSKWCFTTTLQTQVDIRYVCIPPPVYIQTASTSFLYILHRYKDEFIASSEAYRKQKALEEGAQEERQGEETGIEKVREGTTGEPGIIQDATVANARKTSRKSQKNSKKEE